MSNSDPQPNQDQPSVFVDWDAVARNPLTAFIPVARDNESRNAVLTAGCAWIKGAPEDRIEPAYRYFQRISPEIAAALVFWMLNIDGTSSKEITMHVMNSPLMPEFTQILQASMQSDEGDDRIGRWFGHQTNLASKHRFERGRSRLERPPRISPTWMAWVSGGSVDDAQAVKEELFRMRMLPDGPLLSPDELESQGARNQMMDKWATLLEHTQHLDLDIVLTVLSTEARIQTWLPRIQKNPRFNKKLQAAVYEHAIAALREHAADPVRVPDTALAMLLALAMPQAHEQLPPDVIRPLHTVVLQDYEQSLLPNMPSPAEIRTSEGLCQIQDHLARLDAWDHGRLLAAFEDESVSEQVRVRIRGLNGLTREFHFERACRDRNVREMVAMIEKLDRHAPELLQDERLVAHILTFDDPAPIRTLLARTSDPEIFHRMFARCCEIEPGADVAAFVTRDSRLLKDFTETDVLRMLVSESPAARAEGIRHLGRIQADRAQKAGEAGSSAPS